MLGPLASLGGFSRPVMDSRDYDRAGLKLSHPKQVRQRFELHGFGQLGHFPTMGG
jgi:hypothetical protein